MGWAFEVWARLVWLDGQKKKKGAVARTQERETEKGTVHKLGHSPEF